MESLNCIWPTEPTVYWLPNERLLSLCFLPMECKLISFLHLSSSLLKILPLLTICTTLKLIIAALHIFLPLCIMQMTLNLYHSITNAQCSFLITGTLFKSIRTINRRTSVLQFNLASEIHHLYNYQSKSKDLCFKC